MFYFLPFSSLFCFYCLTDHYHLIAHVRVALGAFPFYLIAYLCPYVISPCLFKYISTSSANEAAHTI